MAEPTLREAVEALLDRLTANVTEPGGFAHKGFACEVCDAEWGLDGKEWHESWCPVSEVRAAIARPVPERVWEIGWKLIHAAENAATSFGPELAKWIKVRDRLLEELAALCQPEPMSPPAPEGDSRNSCKSCTSSPGSERARQLASLIFEAGCNHGEAEAKGEPASEFMQDFDMARYELAALCGGAGPDTGKLLGLLAVAYQVIGALGLGRQPVEKILDALADPEAWQGDPIKDLLPFVPALCGEPGWRPIADWTPEAGVPVVLWSPTHVKNGQAPYPGGGWSEPFEPFEPFEAPEPGGQFMQFVKDAFIRDGCTHFRYPEAPPHD